MPLKGDSWCSDCTKAAFLYFCSKAVLTACVPPSTQIVVPLSGVSAYCSGVAEMLHLAAALRLHLPEFAMEGACDAPFANGCAIMGQV